MRRTVPVGTRAPSWGPSRGRVTPGSFQRLREEVGRRGLSFFLSGFEATEPSLPDLDPVLRDPVCFTHVRAHDTYLDI